MKKVYTLILTMALAIGATTLQAQVKFKLSFDTDRELYTVSMVSMVEYAEPMNLTGTGQVTIRVPAGKFELDRYKDQNAITKWEPNARNNSPVEAPEWDYISFGLINDGLVRLPFREGVEVPLFIFANRLGCTGPVELVDNETDPFMAPNSQHANVGNELAVLGAGGDAYEGILEEGSVDCLSALNNEMLGRMEGYNLYPIPTAKLLNFEFIWLLDNQDVDLHVQDASGKLVSVKKYALHPGHNHLKIDVKTLAGGAYSIKLFGSDWDGNVGQFIKARM